MSIEKENQAVIRIAEMIEQYRDELSTLWRWGDGRGGYILEEMRKIVGKEEPAPVKRYSKKTISRTLRNKVMERDFYRCLECGTHKDLSLDHIKPESKGGESTEENLRTLCRSCNSKKGVSEL